MKNSVADLITNLDGCEQELVWEFSLKFFEQHGFHLINYGMIDKMNGNLLGFHSNMSKDWTDHYLEAGYSIDDPFANHSLTSDKPITFNREGPSELVYEAGTNAENMIREMGDFNMNSSICVPIHNAFGHLITGFNLSSCMDRNTFHLMLAEHMDDILLGVALVNNRLIETPESANELLSWRANQHYKPLLSERELEVLRWLSEGHRNGRIADKMKIASVTVNFHLKEIKRKLGAQTREQSVALAFKKGLLR